jgi:Fic/DOC family
MYEVNKTSNFASVRYLRCPPPQKLTLQQQRSLDAMYLAVDQFRARDIANTCSLVGRELRVVYELLEDAEAKAGPNSAIEPWLSRSRFVLIRPAMEPIGLSYWAQLKAASLSTETALKLVSTLVARPIKYTSKPMGTTERGTQVLFEPRSVAAKWLDDVYEWLSHRDYERGWPIYAYARIILAHPFNDGNGRFSRLFFQGCLAHQFELIGPFLALAPAFYKHAGRLHKATELLSAKGDWDGFFAAFSETVIEAVYLTDNTFSPAQQN